MNIDTPKSEVSEKLIPSYKSEINGDIDQFKLISLKDLFGYDIFATDGELGKIFDFYFDDESWTVQYLVVRLENWPDRDKVLLSPVCVKKIDGFNRRIDVALDKARIEASPNIDTQKPVSRRMEVDILNHYRWPLYWSGIGVWGTTADYLEKSEETQASGMNHPHESDTHLRSAREVIGYQIHSSNKKFGMVQDILSQVENWKLPYFVVGMRRWLPSEAVLLTPKAISSISWKNGEFETSLSFSEVRNLPKYHHSQWYQ